MFEIIALMKPVQLNESSVSDAIDTPKPEVTCNVTDIQDDSKLRPSSFEKFTKLAANINPYMHAKACEM